MNISGNKKRELSSSSSLARGTSPDSMHVSKEIANELDVNQDSPYETVVSDIVLTEHGINVQDLTLPEVSSELVKVLMLAIKASNTKLETKFAEVKKESNSLTETVFSLLIIVYSLTEPCRSITQENTQLKEDLLQLEYHQRRSNLVFDGIHEENGETH